MLNRTVIQRVYGLQLPEEERKNYGQCLQAAQLPEEERKKLAPVKMALQANKTPSHGEKPEWDQTTTAQNTMTRDNKYLTIIRGPKVTHGTERVMVLLQFNEPLTSYATHNE